MILSTIETITAASFTPRCHNYFVHCRTVLIVFLFIGRAFISGGFQATYVYTPEVLSLFIHLQTFCTIDLGVKKLCCRLSRKKNVRC